MVALFDTDALFLTLNRGMLEQAAHCVVLDSKGALVASAHDRVSNARWFARALSFAGRGSRYEWDLLDPDGNRMLDVRKPKQRLRGASPSVALADGRHIGRAASEGIAGLPAVSLLGAAEQPLGRLQPALGERRGHPILMYRIVDAEGTPVGEIARETTGTWGFHLLFAAEAELPLRALCLAYVLCMIQDATTMASI